IPRTLLFSFNAPATTEISTLSLHDALPIWWHHARAQLCRQESFRQHAGDAAAEGEDHLHGRLDPDPRRAVPRHGRHLCARHRGRSEEHTSELQSLTNLVCRLLLEKKKKKQQ